MLFGVSHKLPDAACLADIKAAGFDYVEISLKNLYALDDDAFEAFAETLKASGLPCISANCLFTANLQLTGPEVNPEALRAYLEKTLSRAARLGVRLSVLGSGKSRKIPEGETYAMAEDELAKVCRDVLEPFGERFDMLFAVEPLSREDTDLINTVEEGALFKRKLDLPHFCCLADNFHMYNNGDAYENITLAGDDLFWMHIANPVGRLAPLPGDGHDYSAYFGSLKKLGYTGGVTVESKNPAADVRRQVWTDCCRYLHELAGE